MSTFIQQAQTEDPHQANIQPSFRKRSRLKTLFCSNLSKAAFLLICIGTLLLLLYIFVFNGIVSNDGDRIYYCTANEESRIPCGHANISEEECANILCCFNSQTGTCYHFVPSKYFYEKHDSYYMPSQAHTPFGQDMLPELYLTVQEKTPDKFSLILHDSKVIMSPNSIEQKNYAIIESEEKLSINVLNINNNNGTILSTEKSALIASADYWEWSLKFTSGTIFGLDRNLITLSTNESITKVIYKNKLDHNTSPVFWAYYEEYFYGCVIKHDGPMEIQVLASNIIILRSIVGKKIEIGISMGSTPSEVYKQQVEDIVVPPLWTLGTHNCRDSESVELDELLKTYTDNKDSDFDTDCIHKNLFMALQRPSVSEDDLNSFQATLKNLTSSNKFLLYLPPHIIANEANPLYVVARQHEILYKYQSEIVYNGSYLRETVVFPDYSHQYAETFIQALMEWITEKFGIENISGFVLSDNWPQDDSYRNVEPNYSSYYSEEFTKHMQYTLPWSLKGSNNRMHLENHNFYGSSQNRSLYSYMNKTSNLKDLVVITPTKNYGETEFEIVDNYETSWDNFRLYLSKILFQSITGNIMVGLPICGDTESYSKSLHETLCLRWYLAAATMPYFLVSSGDPFRDPANLNSKFATKVVDLAIKRRKLLVDYYYTILSRKEPLVRPMYYDYFSNPATLTMDTQYTIGSELIVAHPITQGMSKLRVYLPPEKGNWYEFWGGEMYAPKKKEQYILEVDIVETDWVMFVAQGNIVALTEESQLNLYIALACSDKNCTASGELNKDNTILSFVADNSSVTISNLPRDCNYLLGFLKVYGYEGRTGYNVEYDKNEAIVCDDSSTSEVTISY